MSEATPTVRDLLALPELAGARLLGGSGGLDAHVRAVAVARRVDAAAIGPGAAVLLVPPEEATSLDADIALRHCAERGATLLLVPARLAAESAARIADRLGIPAAALSDGDPWALAARLDAAVRAPRLERADAALAAARAVRRAQADPRGAVEALGGVLRMPVAILDAEGAAVAGAAPPGLPAGLLDAAPRTLPATDGGLLVAAPITLATVPEAWLVAGPAEAGPARTAAVASALEIAAAALSGTFARRRLAVERDARLRAVLLGDLLTLAGPPPPALAERVVAAGWRSAGWHIGVHLTAPGADATELGAATPRVEALLAEHGLDAVTVAVGGGWSAWVSTDAEPDTTGYRAVVRAVRALVQSAAPALVLHAGIGAPHAGLRGIGRTVEEARQACLLAGAGRPGPAVEPVGEHDARRLLLGSYGSPAFRAHAESLLAPLVEGRDAGLLPTLEAYLEHESSTAATAAALGVHRNTVLHRVRRAEQLLGVSLSQPDERLTLQLACRVFRESGL